MPTPRKPIEVILEQSDMGGDSYFVVLINVPYGAGKQRALVIPQNARPRAQAEVIKLSVELALHEYRFSKPKRAPKKPVRKTAWDRIKKEILP